MGSIDYETKKLNRRVKYKKNLVTNCYKYVYKHYSTMISFSSKCPKYYPNKYLPQDKSIDR